MLTRLPLRPQFSLLLLWLVFAYAVAREFNLGHWAGLPVAGFFCLWVALEWRQLVPIARLTFGAAIAISAWALITKDVPTELWQGAIGRAAFFVFFLVAMDMLRAAAMTSPMVLRSGQVIVHQPPGRRYAVMTLGAHLFAALLNIGSVTLLGTMTRRSIAGSADTSPRIRAIRLRRMTLAVVRGFTSYTFWGPTAVTTIVVTSLIPGLSWVNYAPYGIALTCFYLFTGWSFDRIFNPRAARSGPPKPLILVMAAMTPMAGLVGLMLGAALLISAATGVRLMGALFMSLPVFGTLWIWVQYRRAGPQTATALTLRRLRRSTLPGLISLRSEITLLSSAAFLSAILPDQINTQALALSVTSLGLTEGILLAGLTWGVAFAAPLGLNPLITVAVGTEILLRLDGYDFVPHNLAIAGVTGWGLASAGSPISATLRIAGRTVAQPASMIGLRWNLGFSLFVLGTLTGYQLVAN